VDLKVRASETGQGLVNHAITHIDGDHHDGEQYEFHGRMVTMRYFFEAHFCKKWENYLVGPENVYESKNSIFLVDFASLVFSADNSKTFHGFPVNLAIFLSGKVFIRNWPKKFKFS